MPAFAWAHIAVACFCLATACKADDCTLCLFLEHFGDPGEAVSSFLVSICAAGGAASGCGPCTTAGAHGCFSGRCGFGTLVCTFMLLEASRAMRVCVRACLSGGLCKCISQFAARVVTCLVCRFILTSNKRPAVSRTPAPLRWQLQSKSALLPT